MTSAPRRRLAVDLDGTIFPFYELFKLWYESVYKVKLPPTATWKSVWLEDVLGCTPEEAGLFVQAFYDQLALAGCRPIAGSIEAMTILAETYDLYLVTANGHHREGEIRAWVDLYFPGLFRDVILTDLFGGPGGRLTKVQAMENIGAELIVEDRDEYAHQAVAAGLMAVVITRYMWGNGAPHRNLRRARGFHDVPAMVDELMSQRAA